MLFHFFFCNFKEINFQTMWKIFQWHDKFSKINRHQFPYIFSSLHSRYIYVCHPPLARTWCTMPRVRKCILGICVAAFLHQSTRFFDRSVKFYTISKPPLQNKGTIYRNQMSPTRLENNDLTDWNTLRTELQITLTRRIQFYTIYLYRFLLSYSSLFQTIHPVLDILGGRMDRSVSHGADAVGARSCRCWPVLPHLLCVPRALRAPPALR